MSEWDESLLFPALYVGNVASSSQSDMTQPDAAEIYALPAMVDKSVPLIPVRPRVTILRLKKYLLEKQLKWTFQ